MYIYIYIYIYIVAVISMVIGLYDRVGSKKKLLFLEKIR